MKIIRVFPRRTSHTPNDGYINKIIHEAGKRLRDSERSRVTLPDY